MTHTILLTILTTGFTISFFHASIPTHWLPFVLASRAQKWSVKKTLGITLLAGTGHILMTTLLGVLIVWIGLKIDESIGSYFSYFAAAALWFMGLFYMFRHWRGKGHSHFEIPFVTKQVKRYFQKAEHLDDEPDHDHSHEHHHHHHHHHDHGPSVQRSERMTILSLFILLTCSPCEGFLPVYISGVSFGWLGFLFLTLILGLGTLLGMLIFTFLALKGIEKINIQIIERNESLIMGVLLIVLGVVVIFVEG